MLFAIVAIRNLGGANRTTIVPLYFLRSTRYVSFQQVDLIFKWIKNWFKALSSYLDPIL